VVVHSSAKWCRIGAAAGFTIKPVAAPLRVNPEALRSAAAAESEVGAFLSGIGTGRAVTGVSGALPGLDSGSACELAGTVLDRFAGALAGELTAHSERLSLAADLYVRADEDIARRCR
jgi:hypothetical protein